MVPMVKTVVLERTVEYRVEALSEATWPAFQTLVAKHNGIFGGCWCTYFHPLEDRKEGPDGEAVKHRLVLAGRAHAALVMDGDAAVGWAEYGTPVELPGIYHRKEYESSGIDPAAYRITCFFVDRDHRRRGVATLALQGALELISGDGGGTVEGYPRTDLDEKKISSSFLYNGTLRMFEDAGFTLVQRLGKLRCIMRTTVPTRG